MPRVCRLRPSHTASVAITQTNVTVLDGLLDALGSRGRFKADATELAPKWTAASANAGLRRRERRVERIFFSLRLQAMAGHLRFVDSGRALHSIRTSRRRRPAEPCRAILHQKAFPDAFPFRLELLIEDVAIPYAYRVQIEVAYHQNQPAIRRRNQNPTHPYNNVCTWACFPH